MSDEAALSPPCAATLGAIITSRTALKVRMTNVSKGSSIFHGMMRNDLRVKLHPGIQGLLEKKQKD